MRKPRLTKKQIRQHLFAEAAAAQTAFWDALLELETAIGFDLDANEDLEATDLETLRAEAKERDRSRSSHLFSRTNRTISAIVKGIQNV